MKPDPEANKQHAVDFYRTAFLGNPKRAVECHVGDEYIQHNPEVNDGKQGFIDYFDEMHREYPGRSIEFVRVISEDDLVALHTHQVWPCAIEFVSMDIFRFDENGRIVEHWNTIQEIPAASRNANGMY